MEDAIVSQNTKLDITLHDDRGATCAWTVFIVTVSQMCDLLLQTISQLSQC